MDLIRIARSATFIAHYGDDGARIGIEAESLPPVLELSYTLQDMLYRENPPEMVFVDTEDGCDLEMRLELLNASVSYRFLERDHSRCCTYWVAVSG